MRHTLAPAYPAAALGAVLLVLVSGTAQAVRPVEAPRPARERTTLRAKLARPARTVERFVQHKAFRGFLAVTGVTQLAAGVVNKDFMLAGQGAGALTLATVLKPAKATSEPAREPAK